MANTPQGPNHCRLRLLSPYTGQPGALREQKSVEYTCKFEFEFIGV